MKKLSAFFSSIENAPLSLGGAMLAFLALILARLTVEGAVGAFEPHSFSYVFFEFSHTFLFFACSFLLFLPLARYAGKAGYQQAANLLLAGFLLILTPPLIDTLVFRGKPFWSFYAFDGLAGLISRYFTLFGDSPDLGITYGVRIEVVLVTLGLGLYAFIRRKSLMDALFVALASYTILFVLGTFPSWLTLLLEMFQKPLWTIRAADVAGIFLSPERMLGQGIPDLRSALNMKMSLVYGLLFPLLAAITFLSVSRHAFSAFLRNARVPQLCYHAGLLLLGMLLAVAFTGDAPVVSLFQGMAVLLLVAASQCAWIASVVVNDIFDQRIDALTNPSRPLVVGAIPLPVYAALGGLFFLFSLLFAGIVSFQALLLLLGYQAIAWLYSTPPLRLKRVPGLATLLAAFAGLLILWAGFLAVASEDGLRPLPISISLFLLVAYAASLPLKDFKDIAGDKADRIYTLPVLLGEQRAKWLVGSVLFASYAWSPFLLNARALFPFALLCGSVAFWLLQKGVSRENSLFSFRRLPGLELLVIAIYGAVSFLVLFK